MQICGALTLIKFKLNMPYNIGRLVLPSPELSMKSE
uniref:Uncharacterized protein n=1 Tax=Anguilla anguilla TaxID=7936 RepID=A0A0E9RGI8_ANGAN